jgi:hypothetical protein
LSSDTLQVCKQGADNVFLSPDICHECVLPNIEQTLGDNNVVSAFNSPGKNDPGLGQQLGGLPGAKYPANSSTPCLYSPSHINKFSHTYHGISSDQHTQPLINPHPGNSFILPVPRFHQIASSKQHGLIFDSGQPLLADPKVFSATAATPRRGGQLYTKFMLDIYAHVSSFNCPNFKGARIPLPTDLNIEVWRQATSDYKDAAVVDFLEFGWPISYTGPIPTLNHANHSSALNFQEHVDKFTDLEVKLGAMLGPFQQPTFTPWSHVNPILTRPKKNSQDRRVILDLSFPHPPLYSVNGGTSTDIYLGEPIKLRLPSAMDLAALIVQTGRNCFVFGIDIARAYRQFSLDPCDFPLTGLHTSHGYFTDISLPFGLRWASMSCQRSLSVLVHVCAKQGVQLILYIDDFAGCASSLKQATQQFQLVRKTLVDFGVQEATHKATLPSKTILWLGLLFNTVDMTVSIPPEKLSDIIHHLYAWHSKLSAHRQQLQSLLGKLFHVSQCVLPARKFLNRMLATLRKCPQVGRVLLDDDFRKDVRWFINLCPLPMAFICWIKPGAHWLSLKLTAVCQQVVLCVTFSNKLMHLCTH